ncbi:MAG: carboxymethylenebutenolidase [Robiginitomaculum sp.]|nr:MAG: carboxymethylenebutenolidase [Robiginitomaculum sp.]
MSDSLMISTDDGTFSGYLALPKTLPAPGIVVLQEIFGVNASMQAICDWLAREGYCAYCPDLFWRIEPGIEITDKTDAEMKRAFELYGLFDTQNGMTDIAASITALRKHPSCDGRVGTLGFCLGGNLAYLCAARTDTDASVSYYGVGIENLLDEVENITKPLMLHIAGKDEFVPPSAQKSVIKTFENNTLVTTCFYPDRDHAFARPMGTHYHEGDAKLAHKRTLGFLENALRA